MSTPRDVLSPRRIPTDALWLGPVIGFGIAAFASEWFYASHTADLVPLSPRATSVAAWSLVVLLAAGLRISQKRRLPAELFRRLWAVAILVYAASLALSVAIAVIRTGTLSPAWNGAQAIVIALAAIPIAILIGDRVRIAGAILFGLLALELLYSAVQLAYLPAATGTTNWVTVGNATRWWDASALFGTFATTGKNFYANSLALCGAALLPWALYSRSLRTRLMAGVTGLAIAYAVILSLSRGALLSLIVAAVVVVAVRWRAPSRVSLAALLIGVAFLLAAAWVVPPVRTHIRAIQHRGVVDESARLRFQIWKETLQAPGSLLAGEGFARAYIVTRRAKASREVPAAYRGGAATENLFLRRLVEGGAVGLAALVAAFALLFMQAVRRAQTALGETWRVSILAVVAALFVQSLTSDTIFLDQQAAVFALTLGLAGAAIERERSSEPPARIAG